MVVRALSAPLLPYSTFHDTTLNCKVEAKESEKIREKKRGQGMNRHHLRFRESRICKAAADNYLPIGLFLRDFLFSSQSSLGAMIAASEWSSSPLAQRRKTIQTGEGEGRKDPQKIRLRWRIAKKKRHNRNLLFLRLRSNDSF